MRRVLLLGAILAVVGSPLFASAGWRIERGEVTNNLWTVFFRDREHGWAGGSDGTILATADGEGNWRVRYTEKGERFFAIHFVDSTLGWAASCTGKIMHIEERHHALGDLLSG